MLSPASQGGNVQFKSLSITDAIANQQTMSGTSSVRLTENSLRGLNNSRNNSQPKLDDKSIAERSINYM